MDERVARDEGLDVVDGHVRDPEGAEDDVEYGGVHFHQDARQEVRVVEVDHLEVFLLSFLLMYVRTYGAHSAVAALLQLSSSPRSLFWDPPHSHFSLVVVM